MLCHQVDIILEIVREMDLIGGPDIKVVNQVQEEGKMEGKCGSDLVLADHVEANVMDLALDLVLLSNIQAAEAKACNMLKISNARDF